MDDADVVAAIRETYAEYTGDASAPADRELAVAALEARLSRLDPDERAQHVESSASRCTRR